MCIVSCILLLCILCACGGGSREDHLGLNDEIPQYTKIDNYNATPTPAVPSMTPFAVQTPGLVSPTPAIPTMPVAVTPTPSVSVPVRTPVVAPTPARTPTIVPTPTPFVDTTTVLITKNPTSEVVDEGGRAVFIARADNDFSISWSLVSPDLNTVYDAKLGEYYFSGLKVEGETTEKLVLTQIPYTLNGWRARCCFNGVNNQQKYSEMALVTVNQKDPLELRAKQLAETCRNTAKMYADYCGFATSDIDSFTFTKGASDATSTFGEFNLIMSYGAIQVRGLYRTYPGSNSYYPVSLLWMEGGQYVNGPYWFNGSDANVWKEYEKTLLEITAHYGGAAGYTGGTGYVPSFVAPTPTPGAYYPTYPTYPTYAPVPSPDSWSQTPTYPTYPSGSNTEGNNVIIIG